MPRDFGQTVDNSFVGGLKTEFTGLNFPDNSCTETFNCIFNKNGLIERRLGFSYEPNFVYHVIEREGCAINSYVWKNVNGDGETTLFVLQVGSIVYFFKLSDVDVNTSLSEKKLDISINLEDYITDETVMFRRARECDFTDGKGFLFIFHCDIDPLFVEFVDDSTLNVEKIEVSVRDFEGLPDPDLEDTENPATLTPVHRYNLANQGWNKGWVAYSTTEMEFAPSFTQKTLEIDSANLPIKKGDLIHVFRGTDETDPQYLRTFHYIATVIDYTGTSLTFKPTNGLGEGVFSEWIIVPRPAFIQTWKLLLNNYPSRCDVPWLWFDSDDRFEPEQKQDKLIATSGPAPKGYFVYPAFYWDRTAASGIPDLPVKTSGGIRPKTGVWFAGRLWFTGVDVKDFNENIYFSQIVENNEQFGRCYQNNDPTFTERSDLLPADGGVIRIHGAGTIHKLFPTTGGMLVFAERGVWMILGSQGLGFSAVDYTVQKLSSVPTVSGASFVDVHGTPLWWTDDGIYTVVAQEGGSLAVISITDKSIATFYQSLPDTSRRYAKGVFNPFTLTVQWLYKDTKEVSSLDRYNFTHILNFDTQTGAFYPWKIYYTGKNYVNGVFVFQGNPDIDSPETNFKYVTTYKTTTQPWRLTFSDVSSGDYVDWAGTSNANYDSYLVTGYRVLGQGMRFFQLPYIDVIGTSGKCDVQTRWDYTESGATGKWSSVQRVHFDRPDRKYQAKRLRLRGHGRAVQLKFAAVQGEPLSLIGWTTFVAINKLP